MDMLAHEIFELWVNLSFFFLSLSLVFFFLFFQACILACFGLYHSVLCGWVTWCICTHVYAQGVHKDAMRGLQVSTTVYSPFRHSLSLTLVPWGPPVYIYSSRVPDACSQAQMSHGCSRFRSSWLYKLYLP